MKKYLLLLVATLAMAFVSYSQSPQFTPAKVGIDQDLSFTTSDLIQGTTGYYPAMTVVTKFFNGALVSKNIGFYLTPVKFNPVGCTSQLIENELRYYTKTSSSNGVVIFERPANPLNRKGKSTGLPKSKITYTNTTGGSTKVVRDETPFYTFNCLAYNFMIGKTPAEIAAYCNVDNVTFKGGEATAVAGTGINFTATADRVAKDALGLFGSTAKLWDKCSLTTTSVTANANQIHSVFPWMEVHGDTLINTTFVNETFWKDISLVGMNGFAINSNVQFTNPTFTYRMKLLNGCTYTNATESQLILGYGLFGQCGGYSDFYWDSSEKNADKWLLVQSTNPHIDRGTNTIYYNSAFPAYVMLECTVAPKSNPNAKVWATDVCLDLRDLEQHGDLLIWFADKP
jgi:hypothetical protein